MKQERNVSSFPFYTILKFDAHGDFTKWIFNIVSLRFYFKKKKKYEMLNFKVFYYIWKNHGSKSWGPITLYLFNRYSSKVI